LGQRNAAIAAAPRTKPWLSDPETAGPRDRATCEEREPKMRDRNPVLGSLIAAVVAAAAAIVTTAGAPVAAAAAVTRRTEPSSTGGKTVHYEPARVRLVGQVRRQVFPGPPNFRSVALGDRPEPAWVLHLERPVSVVAAPGDLFNQSERNVRQMQLVLTTEPLRKLAPLVNRRVRATGSLFHGHTAHHHTPVLLVVTDLRLQESAKRPGRARAAAAITERRTKRN
jgi:hypothetical protein